MLRCKKLYKNYIIGGFFNGEEHGYVKFAPEPFKIKMVENMARLDKEERKEAIKTAGYNTFLLKSERCLSSF